MAYKTEDDFKQIYTVLTDFTEVDDFINICLDIESSCDIELNELIQSANNLKNTLQDKENELSITVAELLKSKVQENITANGSILSGLMFHSVEINPLSNNSVEVSETAHDNGFFYPAVVEQGQDPVEGKLMVFEPVKAMSASESGTGNFGDVVFTRKRKKIPAKPFWEPAVQQTDSSLQMSIDMVYNDVEM